MSRFYTSYGTIVTPKVRCEVKCSLAVRFPSAVCWCARGTVLKRVSTIMCKIFLIRFNYMQLNNLAYAVRVLSVPWSITLHTTLNKRRRCCSWVSTSVLSLPTSRGGKVCISPILHETFRIKMCILAVDIVSMSHTDFALAILIGFLLQ